MESGQVCDAEILLLEERWKRERDGGRAGGIKERKREEGEIDERKVGK